MTAGGSAVAAAPTAAPVAERVDAVLDGFLREQEGLWHTPERRPVLDTLRRFVLGGGKRLRPAFCHLGWQSARPSPGTADDAAIVAGAALELFHCFALIHDDLIDGSALRRGEPSVHERFAVDHARRWGRACRPGEAAHVGRSIALLCGDLCASWSDLLFSRCDTPPGRLRAARELFATARAEAIAGEYLDLISHLPGTTGGRHAVARAVEVARLKTARYTVTRPLQIGAALAGGDPRLLRGYLAVGDPLGEAYQLRDDVLGVFGDPQATGKAGLDDLRQGRLTVLLGLAFANADDGQLRTLRSLIGDPGLDAAGADTVRSIVVECGALAATERRIRRDQEAALNALAALDLPDDVRAALTRLAEAVTQRSR